MTKEEQIKDLEREWAEDARWDGVVRNYSASDVIRLRGTIRVEHTIARLGAERLWQLMQTTDYVNALGAMTGGQAVQQVQQESLPVCAEKSLHQQLQA